MHRQIPPIDDDRDDRDDDVALPPVPASERARYYDLVREMEAVIAALIDAYHTAQELHLCQTGQTGHVNTQAARLSPMIHPGIARPILRKETNGGDPMMTIGHPRNIVDTINNGRRCAK